MHKYARNMHTCQVVGGTWRGVEETLAQSELFVFLFREGTIRPLPLIALVVLAYVFLLESRQTCEAGSEEQNGDGNWNWSANITGMDCYGVEVVVSGEISRA